MKEIMLNNLKANKFFWILVGVISAVVAGIGIYTRGGIYVQVVDPKLIPGTYGQDWISLVAGILLIVMALMAKQGSVKKQVVILGLLGYFFYAYGIYVIERTYNSLYLWYMAIFTLSFWGIVYALANLKKELLPNVQLPRPVRIFSLLVALLQPVVFYPMWIAALLDLMHTHNRIENLFSIYILDLCFIMPAFLGIVIMLAKKKALGYLLTPAIFILGFTLIFSLSVSELVKPVFNMAISGKDLVSSLALSLLFIAAAALHLKKMRAQP